MWTFDAQEPVDEAFFARRIEQSALRRQDFSAPADSAARLVHSESDGLPGLIVDRYASTLVFQLLTAGAEAWRTAIIQALTALYPEHALLERSDVDVRAKEGLAPRVEVIHGCVPEQIAVQEHGVKFIVDVRGGHKTGMYLDQRASRWRVQQTVRTMGSRAGDCAVLNYFAYTGGFGLAALAGGAGHVTHLDASAPALALAEQGREANGFAPQRMETVCGDAFEILRAWHKQSRTFDLIVLDPPKFMESKAHLNKACRGYKDVNLCAFRLLKPQGRLFTFSCSGLMDEGLFQKIVADAALDAGRVGRIVGRLAQAADHPVELAFPEGAYLKGLEVIAE